jgi:hypothetical protein
VTAFLVVSTFFIGPGLVALPEVAWQNPKASLGRDNLQVSPAQHEMVSEHPVSLLWQALTCRKVRDLFNLAIT